MMGNELQIQHTVPANSLAYEKGKEFVTMRVGGQLFGISVMAVRDVLRGMKVTKVPLSPPEIAGSLNLRGRIVTAIDLSICFELQKSEPIDFSKVMSVVVEYKGEFFSLIVDSVDEVINLPAALMEKPPANLSPHWKEVAEGIYKLEEELIIILDIQKLLKF